MAKPSGKSKVHTWRRGPDRPPRVEPTVIHIEGEWGYLSRPEGDVRVVLVDGDWVWTTDQHVVVNARQLLSMRLGPRDTILYFKVLKVHDRLEAVPVTSAEEWRVASLPGLQRTIIGRDRWSLSGPLERRAGNHGRSIPPASKWLVVQASRVERGEHLVLHGAWVRSDELPPPPQKQPPPADPVRKLRDLGHLRWATWALYGDPPGDQVLDRPWLEPVHREALRLLLAEYEQVEPTWTLAPTLTKELGELRVAVRVPALHLPFPSLFLRIPAQVFGFADEVGVHVFADGEDGRRVRCVFVRPLPEPPYYQLVRAAITDTDSGVPAGIGELEPIWWCVRQLLVACSRPPRATGNARPPPVSTIAAGTSSAGGAGGRPPRVVHVNSWLLTLEPNQFHRDAGGWSWTSSAWHFVRRHAPPGSAWVQGHWCRFPVRKENVGLGEIVEAYDGHKCVVRRWRRHHPRGHDPPPSLQIKSN